MRSLATAPAQEPASGAHADVTEQNLASYVRERLLLDFGWLFHHGNAWETAKDFGFGSEIYAKSGRLVAPGKIERPSFSAPPGGSKSPTPEQFAEILGTLFGPQKATFDATGWQRIDLPHDWAVELRFENKPDLIGRGCKPLGRDYPNTSIGWYRREYDLPASDDGKRLSIEFDGVYRDCTVALNGHYLGQNFSGYAPFRFDITDFANYGGKNILVVRVDATDAEGWFYEGAGIYRHAWLVKTGSLHVPQWGTFVRSQVRPGSAIVSITTEVHNKESDVEKTCRVVSTLLDASGKTVGSARSRSASLGPWAGSEFEQQIRVDRPALWSLEEPHLYRLVTHIESGGAAVDHYETPFGIRSLRFDASQGFFLNGKPVKIQGTCNHQDHAGVGSALPDRLQSYRIERLKEMGCNGYRTSHNPPTPELLDACDRLGMLVLDETRMMSSNPGRAESTGADGSAGSQSSVCFPLVAWQRGGRARHGAG